MINSNTALNTSTPIFTEQGHTCKRPPKTTTSLRLVPRVGFVAHKNAKEKLPLMSSMLLPFCLGFEFEVSIPSLKTSMYRRRQKPISYYISIFMLTLSMGLGVIPGVKACCLLKTVHTVCKVLNLYFIFKHSPQWPLAVSTVEITFMALLLLCLRKT